MATTKKFLGAQYPFVITPRGIVAQKNGVDQIKADMLQLLLTNPGERVMLPDFGTPLRKLFFEPNDPALEQKARQMIAESLRKWEPRVVISQVEITSNFDKDLLDTSDTGDEAEGILGIKIIFVDPQDISTVDELVIEVPIGGGGVI